jgi:DnaA family protein
VTAHPQLALGLRLRDASSFENFRPGPNREAFERVRAAVPEPGTPAGPARWLYLWGETGTGKTHLLEAACHAAPASGRMPMYIPLREHAELSPALLEDIEQAALVCLDDIDAIAGDAEWERAVFALYERLRASGGMLLVAARANPVSLGFALPDLATRLAAGLVYQLLPLTDADKLAALRSRAARRGFEMTEEVAGYLMARFPRDLHSLFALLDRLDAATLAAQRRLTIPFLRELEKLSPPPLPGKSHS